MKQGQDRAAEMAQVRAVFRKVFRSPTQVGKLAMVALILIVAFVVLPHFYWSGSFPVVWQAIGWVVVIGGTGLVVMVMAADASQS